MHDFSKHCYLFLWDKKLLFISSLNCFYHFFSIQRHKHPFTFYWDVSHRWRRRSWGCFGRSHLYGQCKLRPWDVLYSGTLLSVEKLSLYRKLNWEKPKDWRRYVRPRVTKKSPHFAYFLFSMLSSQSGAGLRNETKRNKTKKKAQLGKAEVILLQLQQLCVT